MIGREFRIRKSQQYNNVYQNGGKFASKCLILFILENKSGINRYGIVTSKKIGNAVTRNKARRRLQALIYENRIELKQGYDIVLVCRPLISKVEYSQIKKDFSILIRKTGIC
ncbi:MAG TPA: ribonuclease P protein component [Syntrophomonadaceae bacterium]|nr:ribonuclease P protein component [Syntrophomonadaceae bacterium]HPR93959.1 ribonuclease P protein component [Syntrophomonadaceae bacterium]